ncbi:MAG: SAM-dependent chlorinase/fluorinase [bacterium]
MGVIALLTDFGHRDPFVGMLKGAIAKVAPDTTVIDLTHDIANFDPRSAAFILEKSLSHFPESTVFLCVVDPGVGSARKILAAQAHRQYFVAPDNGILSYALSGAEAREVFEVRNPQYFVAEPSQTFHGRDIMAPVAAHLSRGLALGELGPAAADYQVLNPPSLLRKDDCVIGEILHVDKYGNLISNIGECDLPRHDQLGELTCRIGAQQGLKLVNSYSEANGPAAIISGFGTVEVFLNRNQIEEQFENPIGTTIAVERKV